MTETALYMYAIGRGLEPTELPVDTGLLGEPLQVVSDRDLAAVVSAVPLEEFGEAGLKRNLERLDWLETVARGHDDVVHAVAGVATVAPLRLATICLDEDAVRRRLEQWYDDLTDALDRVTGRAEWSVKVVVPPDDRAADNGQQAVSGAAYLRQKKSESQARQQRQDEASGVGAAVHDALAEVSVASRMLPPQDPQLTGHTGTMVLNGAYLVEVGSGEQFTLRVQQLAERHPTCRIESAGPWAPYSFAVLDVS